ncbi:hypothetical protein AXK11_02075 [Cephaloticoccus primus]|uniref:NadR/Ttd14 AAA domain-containing protein n=1 Tax=Cephaloticoccus primus TaxID=1548207 RepID=A0A139SSP4_9BACT|nr:ATP-binding protein [Cephaloticoccus primus]KXU37605.1 hypothetical protein AXK11_02075 [Cephaloticoccus primus]
MPPDQTLKRVAVFGIESTGKSTLAEFLGRHYGAPVAPEFVRAFWDAHDGQIGASDLGEIARGQMAAEDAAAAAALARWGGRGGRAQRALASESPPPVAPSPPLRAPLIICDTELLTNQLYDDLLFPGHCPEWLRAEAEQRSRRYALYLLCGIDIPFVPDRMRGVSDPARRAQWQALWRETLVSRGLPFVDICGEWPERQRRAVAAIDALL